MLPSMKKNHAPALLILLLSVAGCSPTPAAHAGAHPSPARRGTRASTHLSAKLRLLPPQPFLVARVLPLSPQRHRVCQPPRLRPSTVSGPRTPTGLTRKTVRTLPAPPIHPNSATSTPTPASSSTSGAPTAPAPASHPTPSSPQPVQPSTPSPFRKP